VHGAPRHHFGAGIIRDAAGSYTLAFIGEAILAGWAILAVPMIRRTPANLAA
jgi:hypothetical protein